MLCATRVAPVIRTGIASVVGIPAGRIIANSVITSRVCVVLIPAAVTAVRSSVSVIRASLVNIAV